MSILVPLASGFEEMEAVSIITILRRARLHVIVASLDDRDLVKGANDLVMQVDTELSKVNVANLDAIVLPGGYDGMENCANSNALGEIARALDARGALVAGICAAPIALDRLGVKLGRYTCYDGCESAIKGGSYIGGSVVVDGHIITGQGPALAIPFALAIIEYLASQDAREKIARQILLG